MSNMLEMMRASMAGEKPEGFRMMFPPPIARLVGFDVVEIERGASLFRMHAQRERHANPMGTIHGGVLVDLADAAMGVACASLLELGESFTTVELKINFFRPVIDAELEARAKVVTSGRTIVYLECEVLSLPEQKLVAKANSTCMVLRGQQAKDR